MKNRMPLSHLINKVLKNYIVGDRYFQELGFLLVSKGLIRNVLGKVEERYLIEEGKQFGAVIAKEYMPYFFTDVSSYTLLEFIDIWLSRFAYQHRIDCKRHIYSVNHDLGHNYSIFFREYMKSLIESIVNSPVKFSSLAANTVIFSFELI